MASTASGPYAKLIVNIKSAHNLTDPTWLGKADPYAILKVHWVRPRFCVYLGLSSMGGWDFPNPCSSLLPAWMLTIFLPSSMMQVAGAEIQTHHIKNAGENATWDET